MTATHASSSSVGAAPPRGQPSADVRPARPRLPAEAARWWPLALVLGGATALRFATIDLQSLWYDEAYTPVHVLHASLFATLRSVAHSENTPPLFYIVAWAWTRIFGTGVIALRSISALAGVGTVAVAWGIGRELAGRRAALVLSILVAVNPLFVWYSQEARAYALFVFMASLALLCFLRARRAPSAGGLAAFALAGAGALATHYFAIFLLAPMCLLLAHDALPPRGQPLRWSDARLRATTIAFGGIGVVGAALVPLVIAQGGQGTQWIGRWPLSSRLDAVPQSYLLGGFTGHTSPLGHAIELLVALPIGLGLLAAMRPCADERGAALTMAAAGGFAVLAPVALALVGVDYLAPRNLVAAWIPITAALAVVFAASRAQPVGLIAALASAAAFLGVVVDVDLSPRLQRGDWAGVASSLRVLPPAAAGAQAPAAGEAIVTPELGSAPLEYYLPELRPLSRWRAVRIGQIVLVGYAPLAAGAGTPPAHGFTLSGRRSIHGLVVYRFTSPAPVLVSEHRLRAAAITRDHPEVLVPEVR